MPEPEEEQRRPEPPEDDEDEFADEEDEQNGELDPGLLQKVLSSFYLVMLLVFIVTASIPFLIIYTVIRITWSASNQ